MIVSGILPNPPEILDFLDAMEIRVGDDDLLSCSRRFSVAHGNDEPPLEAITRNYFTLPPCTTRNSSVQERLDFLFKKIEQTGSKGVIFSMIKFCEPEYFYLPQIVGQLKSSGLATLVIDTELRQTLSGQLKTRLETFAEMVG